MNDHLTHGKETPTSSRDEGTSFDAAVFDTAVQHCFEKLDKLVMRLHRYPIDAMMVAMGTYLQELLGVLLDEHACTGDEIREFLRDIESASSSQRTLLKSRLAGTPPECLERPVRIDRASNPPFSTSCSFLIVRPSSPASLRGK